MKSSTPSLHPTFAASTSRKVRSSWYPQKQDYAVLASAIRLILMAILNEQPNSTREHRSGLTRLSHRVVLESERAARSRQLHLFMNRWYRTYTVRLLHSNIVLFIVATVHVPVQCSALYTTLPCIVSSTVQVELLCTLLNMNRSTADL